MLRSRLIFVLVLATGLSISSVAQTRDEREAEHGSDKARQAERKRAKSDQRAQEERRQAEHVQDRERPNPEARNNARQPANKDAGAMFGEWLQHHSQMSPQEQQKALENDSQFRSLPAGQQAKLRDRLQEFTRRSPQEQQQIIDRMRHFQQLTPEQQERAQQLSAKWHNTPEDRKQAMKGAIHQIAGMSPAEQDQIFASERFKRSFSPEEQEIIRGVTELKVGPASQHEP